MKNLQTLKKFAAIVVSAMMVLSTIAMPTFAADPVDETVLKIAGLEAVDAERVDITAYKIIKQDANGNWVKVKGTDDVEYDITIPEEGAKLTSAQITNLSKSDKLANPITGFTYNSVTKNFEKDLPNGTGNKYGVLDDTGAGMYLVLITNKATATADVRVYNPMVISIAPDKNTDKLIGGTVNPVSGKFEGSDVSGTAYVKSSKPTFDKYIVRDDEDSDSDKANFADANEQVGDLTGTTNVGNGSTSGEGKRGDTDSRGSDSVSPKVGDKVWFEIKTTIPAYSDGYTNPVFKIHDELSEGLDFNKTDLKVYVGGSEVTSGTTTWNFEDESGSAGAVQKYTINFASSYILNGVSYKEVVVKYSATVNQNCKQNFDAETNEAYITYTHKPDETQDSEKIKTYHYTFTINGKLDGEGSNELRELVKVGCSEDSSFVYAETKREENHYVEPIEGAVFRLYTEAQMKSDKSAPKDEDDYYRQATSEADGRIMGFDRLDAGTYYIVEQSVKAPYKVKKDPITVVIAAELDSTTGLLKEYSITVNNVPAAKYVATYDANNDLDTVNNIDVDVIKGHKEAIGEAATEVYDVEAAHIQNTKTGSLPSTGGMGTVLFTVGGIAIMALAIFLLFGGKKKEAQK